MKNCTRKFTEKDLAYITDMFDWNNQAFQLVKHFQKEVEQEEVQELLEEVGNMHYENMNHCLHIVEGKVMDDEYDEEYDEDEEEDEEEDYEEEDNEDEEEEDER